MLVETESHVKTPEQGEIQDELLSLLDVEDAQVVENMPSGIKKKVTTDKASRRGKRSGNDYCEHMSYILEETQRDFLLLNKEIGVNHCHLPP